MYKALSTCLNTALAHKTILAIAKRRYPRKWSVINIEGYNVCNLRCKVCPYENMTRPKEIMPLANFTIIIRKAYDYGIRVANLNIYNEPLLDTLLYARIGIAKAAGMFTQFTTNATWLSSETQLNLIDEKLDRVYVSVDAFSAETYEEIRPGANYAQIVENVIEFSHQPGCPQIVVTFVVQDNNVHELSAFKKFWHKQGLQVLTWPVDNRKGIASQVKHLPGTWTYYTTPCRKLFHELNVLSNGQVVLCCLDYDGRVSLGNLADCSVEEIHNGLPFQAAKRNHLSGTSDRIRICRNCDVLHTSTPYWLGRLLPQSLFDRLEQKG